MTCQHFITLLFAAQRLAVSYANSVTLANVGYDIYS